MGGIMPEQKSALQTVSLWQLGLPRKNWQDATAFNLFRGPEAVSGFTRVGAGLRVRQQAETGKMTMFNLPTR